MRPHLAEATTTIPTGDYIMEPKWDGIRILAHIAEDGVELFTRNGNRKDERVPAICDELATLPNDTWLDGEIVMMGDKERRNDWGTVQSVLGRSNSVGTAPVSFIAFDLLSVLGQDATQLSFAMRRRLLERLFETRNFQHCALTFQLPARKDSHDRLLAQGFEGSVIKNLQSRYRPGERGKGWLKLKASDTMDVIITGYERGRDVGALIFSQYANDELVVRGRCKALKGLHQNVEDLIAQRQVIEVKYNGIMPPSEGYPHGALRHPQVVRVRDDKPARECVVECLSGN